MVPLRQHQPEELLAEVQELSVRQDPLVAVTAERGGPGVLQPPVTRHSFEQEVQFLSHG